LLGPSSAATAFDEGPTSGCGVTSKSGASSTSNVLPRKVDLAVSGSGPTVQIHYGGCSFQLVHEVLNQDQGYQQWSAISAASLGTLLGNSDYSVGLFGGSIDPSFPSSFDWNFDTDWQAKERSILFCAGEWHQSVQVVCNENLVGLAMIADKRILAEIVEVGPAVIVACGEGKGSMSLHLLCSSVTIFDEKLKSMPPCSHGSGWLSVCVAVAESVKSQGHGGCLVPRDILQSVLCPLHWHGGSTQRGILGSYACLWSGGIALQGAVPSGFFGGVLVSYSTLLSGKSALLGAALSSFCCQQNYLWCTHMTGTEGQCFNCLGSIGSPPCVYGESLNAQSPFVYPTGVYLGTAVVHEVVDSTRVSALSETPGIGALLNAPMCLFVADKALQQQELLSEEADTELHSGIVGLPVCKRSHVVSMYELRMGSEGDIDDSKHDGESTNVGMESAQNIQRPCQASERQDQDSTWLWMSTLLEDSG